MKKANDYKGRIIFHVDMNSFYASVEIAKNPALKDKPVAIAGHKNERRGIIVTSNYIARAKGVKTTMPLFMARKLCPNLVVIEPNFSRYQKASTEMFKILAEVSEVLEPVSIDEGYLDVTQYRKEDIIKLANKIKNRLLNELHLPCSIGIAPNKFLAKMASDMKKPLGITVLRKRDIAEKLWPLDVGKMHGVGEKTKEKLNKLGIMSIGDLAKRDQLQLKLSLGINGVRLIERANGIDDRIVDPMRIYDFKSIGNSKTLAYDTTEKVTLYGLLEALSAQVSLRLKDKGFVGQTVQITIRYDDRKTFTRALTRTLATDDATEIFQTAKHLFDLNWHETPVRLLGVTVQSLKEKKHYPEQLDLFKYEARIKEEQLKETILTLTKKLGYNPIKKLDNHIDKQARPKLTTSFQKDFLADYKKDN